MISSKNYVKRKNFQGPVFDVDHLATFTVNSANGLLKAEDGIRKLRNMEKVHGIATMHCQILIDTNYLVVYDKKLGQEVEVFPLDLVIGPTSVLSDNRQETLNNIVLFTVLEDNRKSKGHGITAPTEMHIFQSIKVHSSEIVDEIIRAKSGLAPSIRKAEVSEIKYAPTTSEILNNNVYKQRAAQAKPNKASSQVDFDVQVLNHCFDDIERFVTRLQNSIDSYKELERRKKERKSSKKYIGDGMLTMRSQMPSTQNFVDIFQKIKLSLNLLAKLKAHIHDPNAPELVHFLFTPLALIVNTTREQPYQGIGKTVWTPLLTRDTKDLLLNCLTSKEQDLWMSLGDGWIITHEEARLQPTLLANLNNDVYNPVFYDGWSPKIETNHPVDNVEKIAMETAAHVQANSHKYDPPLPIQKSRYYANCQPINLDEPRGQKNVPLSPRSASNSNRSEIQKWASELTKQGVKIYEVIHDRQANNEKELSVKTGELVEVLDDKRNWWKLRNFYGNVGHAPVTILKPYDTMPQYINQDKNSDGKQQSSILLSSSSLSSSSNAEISDSKTKNPINSVSPQVSIRKQNETINYLNSLNHAQNTIQEENKNQDKIERVSKENTDQDMRKIAPLKEELRDAIESRMSRGNRSELSFNKDRNKENPVILNTQSSASDVKKFLQSKGFSNKVIVMFSELNGAQLFSLNREDFEKFCGKEEGIRLDSHVKIQKSLSGYENQTTELAKILQKRKEKSEENLESRI